MQDWELIYHNAPDGSTYIDMLKVYNNQYKFSPYGPVSANASAASPPGYIPVNDDPILTEFPINDQTTALYDNFDWQYGEEPSVRFPNGIPDIDRQSSIEDIMDIASPVHIKNPNVATIPKDVTAVLPSPDMLGVPIPTNSTLPTATDSKVTQMLQKILGLKFWDDGFNSLPFIQVNTKRVFLPILKNKKSVGTKQTQKQALAGLQTVLGAPNRDSLGIHVNEAAKTAMLKPFPITVAPEKIAVAQRSTRYVYGPWMTNIDTLMFRGKVEYEQDENLLPENFLIPTNFGAFGDFKLKQISGLAGLNLAAQAKANAIDNFALFAQEQGSISVQGAPAIKRIGDSLFGIRNVTDIKVNVTNSTLKTSYSFKTISPRFGRNNADIEKKLTKISNKVKQIKLV